MARKFDRIILHIGLGKTGSTAIQEALVRHASQLEEDSGIHVPHALSDPRPFAGNHSLYLRSLCSDKPHELRFNIAAGLASEQAAAAADRALLRQYEHGFEATGASTLLLSAEGIGHFGDDAMGRLAAWLKTLGERIDVIACVRHPRHALAAEIQQRLKTGALLERLYAQPPFYRYSELFGRVAACFGQDSIQLYDYQEAMPPQSDAVRAFFQRIGVAALHVAADGEAVNVGLSHEATLLLDALNRQRPLLIDGQMNPLRRPGDLAVFTEIPGSEYRPPPEVYTRLDELAAPELAWLSTHYGLCLNAMEEGEGSTSGVLPSEFSSASIDALALFLVDKR